MNALFITSEWKKWTRDSLMLFMLVYPLIFGALGRWGLPWFAEQAGFYLDPYHPLIMGILAILAPHIYGATAGFSILEDRDDHILTSVRVTPLSTAAFLAFRLIMVTAMAFLTNLFVLWFSNIPGLGLSQMLLASFLSCLIAPMCALLINAFASNKVEGFVILKGLMGTAIILPAFGLFFHDAKELFFAIAPGFWPAKIVSSVMHGGDMLFLNTALYFWLGLAYIAVLTLGSARLFAKRVEY